jgi:hypothetical protein
MVSEADTLIPRRVLIRPRRSKHLHEVIFFGYLALSEKMLAPFIF